MTTGRCLYFSLNIFYLSKVEMDRAQVVTSYEAPLLYINYSLL